MAQYLKIHFMSCTNYVQSFMLLLKSAQSFAMQPHYWKNLHLEITRYMVQARSQKLQLGGSFVQNCGPFQQNSGLFNKNLWFFKQHSGPF